MLQMYDPKREYQTHKQEIDAAIQGVLDHGLFINGPEVKELEKKLCDYTGSKHAIGVSNGTDAIKIALLALDVGIDDEVITVAHTWISTAEVVSLIHAKPVFVDIEDTTFTMDPEKIEAKITDKTKAILVVSLYGQPANMNRIQEIADNMKTIDRENTTLSLVTNPKNKNANIIITVEPDASPLNPSIIFTEFVIPLIQNMVKAIEIK